MLSIQMLILFPYSTNKHVDIGINKCKNIYNDLKKKYLGVY